jgi:hypothetical protein
MHGIEKVKYLIDIFSMYFSDKLNYILYIVHLFFNIPYQNENL